MVSHLRDCLLVLEGAVTWAETCLQILMVYSVGVSGVGMLYLVHLLSPRTSAGVGRTISVGLV